MYQSKGYGGIMEDHEIIVLYNCRNEQAIVESDKKYGKYCYRIAYNILSSNEDSEECVNDTWLRTWNAIPPAVPPSLKFFVAKITRNLSIDRYRKSHRAKRGTGSTELQFEDALGSVVLKSTDDVSAISRQLSDDLDSFLNSLSERDAFVFIRRYFFFDSAKAIARRYDLKEEHVFVILSRTRQKLREYLTEKGYTV
ncbi:MAG: sigma-70 family RNA polymerase sigma factor [Clostridia bacterium]|nr:sigma-70 family RNA polymerase sigma factor [Clostridia bacterium]